MGAQKSNNSNEFEDKKKRSTLNSGIFAIIFILLATSILVTNLFLKNKEQKSDKIGTESTQITKKIPPVDTPPIPSVSKPTVTKPNTPVKVSKKTTRKKSSKKRFRKKITNQVKKPKQKLAMALPPTPPEKEILVFAPEDLPMPSKPEIISELKQPVPPPTTQSHKSKGTSSPFKSAMEAYQSNKLKQAAQAFGKIPKPESKQRGNQKREEYVKANFYRGLAFQKTGNLKSAIKAYETVLKYERFYPICEMNLGICYMGLKQYARADKAFKHVIRDQNRIPPDQYDDIMQRTRYFWALTWTKLYKESNHEDKKLYFRKQASMKWSDYKAWFGSNKKYTAANAKADNYIKGINYR